MTIRFATPHPLLRAAIGVAISAAFVMATISSVELHLMSRAWAAVNIALLMVASIVCIAELSVRAVRWRLLLGPLAEVPLTTSLGYLAIGHLANAILPARLGDIARALFAGVRLRVSRASVFGTIAVERLADAGLLGLAISVGVLIGFSELAPTVVTLALVGGLAAIAAVVMLAILRRRSVAATRLGHLLQHHGQKFVAGASALRRPRALIAVGALTVLSFGLAVTILSLVAEAVGLSIPVWQAALIIAAVTLSTAVPAGPASIGTYEFAGLTVMTAMGFPAEQSLLCVALVHATVVVPPSLIGLLAMWWLGVRPHAAQLAPGLHSPATEPPV